MNVSLEQIDELRRRANVGYEEAKDALERNNGDIIEALIYLEKQNKAKGERNFESGFMDSFKKLIRQGQETRFVVRKKDNTVLNIPVNAVVLTTVVMPPLTVIGGMAALFTGHRMKFERPSGSEMDINRVMDRMADTADRMRDQMKKQ
ncbi:MAG: DUF4342 domain-containing protein [Bacillota bacterium]|nr:DUF4342 domain-containing protein [Bacillota bacterium]